MFRTIIDTYRQAYSGLPPQIWMLSAALFVNRFGTMVLPFLTLYLTKSQGFAESAAGWMISVWGLGAVFGTWFGGRLTNRVGSVRLQIILLFFSVPLYLLLPFCRTYLSFALTIFFLSLVSEGVRPANATAITEFSTPQQRTRSFALQRMALNLGISFGPVIGGLLITISFFWIFVADALTTLLCAVVLIVLFGFKKQTASKFSEEERKFVEPVRRPHHDTNFLFYLGLVLICSLVFFQIHATYPLYLSDHYGMNELQIGLIFSVNTVIIVLFEMILVDYARRWNLILTIGWGSFLTCIGFGILPMSTSIWFCVFSMVILTVGEMLSMPFSSAWVSKRSEGSDTGAYMGWYSTNYSLAFIIGPAIGGIIYQQNKDLVFYLSILVAIVVLAGFYILNSRLSSELVENLPESSLGKF